MMIFSSKEKKFVLGIVISFVLLFVFLQVYTCITTKVCVASLVESVARKEAVITFPQGIVHAEVVDTKESRERGLSGRKGLEEHEGMLFDFGQPGRFGFWMKDMLFPIDMIWINSDGIVVHIERNISPDTYQQNPPKTFVNVPPASYVLEIGANESEKYGIYLGTKAVIAK